MSMKLRLSIGAALLGAGTILTALILWMGLNAVAERLDSALASEARIARYAALSTQAATFLVVSSEAVQSGLPAQTRMERIAPVASRLRETFERLQGEVGEAVEAARSLGLDAQSRIATQSLGLARMEAMLDRTLVGLAEDTEDRARLRAHIDGFAAGFDPLLGDAVRVEQRLRAQVLDGIDALRRQLTLTALVIVAATLAALAAFHFGLIRPQFRRLDALRDAADEIEQGRFAVALPVGRLDEIGRLSDRTNRMAAALSARAAEVEAEWTRLNETIAARTEALRRANASLAEIDANRRRFFADVSHELRTPMTVILMEAQIGRKAAPEAAEAFATIEARATRLSRRIDDLLRLARSDTGQLALNPEPVRLPALAEAVRQEVASEVTAAGLTLDVASMPEIAIRADPNWLRQVVAGLLRNAVRHAGEGGRIRLSAAAEDGLAGLSVTDNGPGIPASEQARVFERFVQGAGASQTEGFGVGLALARWVVDAQGGRIMLQSPVPRETALGDAPGLRVSAVVPLAERE